MTLLQMLADDAPAADLAEAADRVAVKDPAARALALRIRSGMDASKRREAELSALVDVARELASAREFGNVLDTIVHRARTLIGTDVAYLTLYDAAQGDTFMRATDGSVSAAFQQLRLPVGAGLGRPGGRDAQALLDGGLPHGWAVRAHLCDRLCGWRRGVGGDLRYAVDRGRRLRRRAVRLEPDPAAIQPRGGLAARLAGRTGGGDDRSGPGGCRGGCRAGAAIGSTCRCRTCGRGT